MKCAFVKDIIREAERFKKKVLIKMLEQFEKSMISTENKRISTNNSSINWTSLR